MIYLQADVQSLGINQPRFNLFQRVRVHAEYEQFEAEGIICGLLIEDSKRYPTSQFFLDGWWYDIGFYNLPGHPDTPCMYRDWVHESEIYPLL
jgi:hypothetical protein